MKSERIRDILYKARKELGVSMDTVQSDTGIYKYYISRIETGKVIPCNGRVLGRLAEYYGIDSESLYKQAREERDSQKESGK